MAASSESRPLPKFKNPPVNETVYGVAFSKLQGMKVPYLGMLWEKYRDDYPKCEEVPRLISTPAELSKDWITPRVWYINSDDSRVIQVQDDRFNYNWRRREENYPNFDTVYPEFKDCFKIFVKFLEEHELGTLALQNLELTYINHIPAGEAWDNLGEIGNLLPDIQWRASADRFLPEPIQLRTSLEFPLPDNQGRLVANIQTAKRISDDVHIIILEISAKWTANQKLTEEFLDWFDLAHKWIVLGFEDLTSTDVQQRVWQKKV